MVLYPAPTRIWKHCPICGIRLTRETMDAPAPPHESWCARQRWRCVVDRLLAYGSTLCETLPDTVHHIHIYDRMLLQRWRYFSETILELSYESAIWTMTYYRYSCTAPEKRHGRGHEDYHWNCNNRRHRLCKHPLRRRRIHWADASIPHSENNNDLEKELDSFLLKGMNELEQRFSKKKTRISERQAGLESFMPLQ